MVFCALQMLHFQDEGKSAKISCFLPISAFWVLCVTLLLIGPPPQARPEQLRGSGFWLGVLGGGKRSWPLQESQFWILGGSACITWYVSNSAFPAPQNSCDNIFKCVHGSARLLRMECLRFVCCNSKVHTAMFRSDNNCPLGELDVLSAGC